MIKGVGSRCGRVCRWGIALLLLLVTASCGGGGGSSGGGSSGGGNTSLPLAPSQVSYGASSFTFSATVASSTLTPKASGGAVGSWSITPALPVGLTFSTTDGSISGTPSAPSASTSYTVTAQNSGGQSTVNLTIVVGASPLITLGHQSDITVLRETATNVLSVDTGGYWILWGYSGASVVASGNSGCGDGANCALTPAADMVGSTVVIATPTGFELHATSDGHTLGTIAASGTWWKLATDGSYVAVGSQTGLSTWSSSGQLLFTRAGDYSKAASFATPTAVLVAAGPAGANVVETIAVPAGTSTTGPQFNGQFMSWFTEGGAFLTSAGTSVLVYSNAGVQRGSFSSLATPTTAVVGQGNWLWIYNTGAYEFVVYPATGSNPAAAATFYLGPAVTVYPSGVYPSGMTVGVVGENSLSVIDLSGATPVKADYSVPVQVSAFGRSSADMPYAAVSASQWAIGSPYGVVLDGATISRTPRYFGYGQVTSVAGGTGHFAVATATGSVLYFNTATLAQEGQLAFPTSKVVLSSDGTVLAAQGASQGFGFIPVQVYSLPSGNLQYSWPAPPICTCPSPPVVTDIVLSGSGTVLGQTLHDINFNTDTQEASAPVGGSPIYTNTSDATLYTGPKPIRISPDGTLIAVSQGFPNPANSNGMPGTSLLLNGVLVTAFTGLPVGWLDNSRLVVNSYNDANSPAPVNYSSCSIYGATGTPTGGACTLPTEVLQFQPVTSDTIYTPTGNHIISVSSGAVSWTSGDPSGAAGALAGSNVVFVSGINLLVQPY